MCIVDWVDEGTVQGMNECWHCKFVMSGSVEMLSVPSVWIRGPDLMIILLCSTSKIKAFATFFFFETISLKNQATKVGEVRPFVFFLLLFLQSYMVYYRPDSAVSSNCAFLYGYK